MLALAFALSSISLRAQTQTNQPGATAPSGANSSPSPGANAPARFWVQGYEIAGNTLLPVPAIESIFVKHTGTNIAFDDISAAMKELQMEYHARGYDTINVTIPQQRITNGIFKIRVFEGRLAEILVKGNRFYSSNNVMKALPSLRTNIILNSKFFQPELDRANGNQDRQIFPEIQPGPESNTTTLVLKVKDRLPLHVKLEADNQSAAATPNQRLNTSAVYNNLWQENHSLGLQYSFAEETYKTGPQWNWYDKPLVANYSGFYRMPLAPPESMEDIVSTHPAQFGYDEATRRFQLPAFSGTPELNVFASRSAIDTGVTMGADKTLESSAANSIVEANSSQDFTVNQNIGFRLSEPLPDFWGVHSHVQAGLDYKTYQVSSFATNFFIFSHYLTDISGNPYTLVSTTVSPVPSSIKTIDYLPVSLRWDGLREDKNGSMSYGLGLSANLYYSGGESNIQSLAGSHDADGTWQVLTASMGRQQNLPGKWSLAMRADGQWATTPLIANEQFGAGGVNGVRGYHEGEVYGDAGWRLTSELKTPTHTVGYVGKTTGHPLTIRGSVFMDYADTYLLNPNGRAANTPLWGAGIAGAASITPHFQGRMMFAFPLDKTADSEAYQLHVIFSLTAEY